MEQLTANGRFICTNTGDKIIQCSNSGQALLLTRAYNGTTAQGIYPDKVKEMYDELFKAKLFIDELVRRIDLHIEDSLDRKSKMIIGSIEALLQSAKIK